MNLRHAVLPLLIAASLPSFDAAAARGFEVRDLAKLDRVSEPTLSPDGRRVVFAKRVMDYAANKASTSLWIEDLFARDAAPPVRLTPEGWSVNSPVFAPDGKSVYFLSGKSGSSQLYSMPAGGGTPKQLTAFDADVGSFQLSPDGKRVAFSVETFAECKGDLACTKKKMDERGQQKNTGMVFDRIFIRHWDAWNDGRLNRLFVAVLPGDGKAVSSATLVSGDVHGDVPSRPFGDGSEYTWSPDGQSLVFNARIADAKEPTSTNFDLYQVAADGSGPAKNLTAANPAWDTGATFSADGKTLYYRAMKRPGFEADRFGLMALDLASGQRREIAPGWDRSADGITLSDDGKTIYTTATDLGEHPLFAVDIASGKATKVVGEGSISAFALAGPTLALTRNTLKSGDVLYTTSADATAPLRPITQATGETLKDVAFGDFEQFDFKGWNGDTVHGYVVKPWNYVEGKKYPVAFLIHGGPQGSFGNGWSYRWNPQTYAGQGYAVVMIDFHGSTGYGQAFTDAISQHWGDRPLEDLQKGWAAVQKKYAFLDGGNACALGASYGGFMVNWIAGNWHTPASGAWKCLVNHDGVFDQRMMGFATEELWFTEWEQGGTAIDKAANYEKFNPVNHVKDWRVPMLVIHGQQDFRIPVEQGIGAFTALQRQGIESKFLYFPDENHWVLKAQNSVQWHDTVNGWLKQHIGQSLP
ncbi:alpha/beta hydrolase family protein [Lysobacter niastensis]|uniref:S9 family peptidase n=1 Tax=Lysobacter niastensis TaxID=380629 RepID=A0ABS0B2M8_9GAMM|nr:S9 family peptidase [Lysobacter niastensis]MBF6022729.1 S9 family peptidase [Lysobacter niastensis]